MRTAIVSDLHLGVGTAIDLLRDEEVRAALTPELEAADRVVLLGDVLELRDRPLRRVLEVARPIFAWLGETVSDGEVVLVPGNHDHHLVAPWLERRAFGGADGIDLEHPIEPLDGPLGELARCAEPARLTFAYPGLWLRPDIYAIHGHYLDRHLTIPTMERLGVALVERLLGTAAVEDGEQAADGGGPREYEQVQTPVYEFLFSLAQATLGDRPGGGPSMRAWELLTGKDSRAARIRGWLLGSVALPGAVGVANRLGLGPVRSDLAPETITAAGLAAMGDVVARLEIESEHVIFGHTHRRGPQPGDTGWSAHGARLWNTGNWVYSAPVLGPDAAGSPYWPGTVARVDEGGEPELVHLLDDWSHDDLERATRA